MFVIAERSHGLPVVILAGPVANKKRWIWDPFKEQWREDYTNSVSGKDLYNFNENEIYKWMWNFYINRKKICSTG